MRIARLAAAVIFLGQAAMPALAGNMKLGQLALNPYYGLTATYDDNIYRVPANINNHAISGGGVRGSWIMSNNLGINFMLPVGEAHKFSAGYDFRADTYRATSSANNGFSQTVNAGYDWKGSVTTARLWDSYTNTRDPQFNPNSTVVAGELVQRQTRWQNAAGAAAEYALGDKFFFGGDFQATNHHYLDRTAGGTLNHSDTLFGIKTGYKIQPKTRLFTAIHRGITHYSGGTSVTHVSNHKDWMVDFGIEGQLSPKITGQVQTGLAYRKMDIDSNVQKFAGVKSVTRNWSTSARLSYKPTERCEFNVSANRALNDAVTGGNFFVSTGFGLDASHMFGDKVKAMARFGVQSDKYSEVQFLGGINAQRRDETYRYGLGADYKFNSWASAGMNYDYTRRHSIFSRQFNFKQSLTSFNLKLNF